ncbi:unnamed protein product [Calypogeia fissa]
MESAASMALSVVQLLPLSSRSPLHCCCASTSSKRFIHVSEFFCLDNGGRSSSSSAGAIRHPYLGRRSFCLKKKSNGGQFVSMSTPFVRKVSSTAVRRRGPWKSFCLPPDVELEEVAEAEGQAEVREHAEGVENGRAGVVAGTDGGKGAEEEAGIQQDGGVDTSSISIWQKFPSRYKLMVTTSLAFVICNMDKVNMSVAVIPMSHQLGWTAATSGLVQSSFFWGYALSQLPGGFLAGRFSGKKVLKAGVLMWSLATALVPMTAAFLPGLLFCRLLVGLGEGVSPAAATDLIARTMPVFERSRAVSFVFGGLNVGSVVGLLLAPAIIRLFGWEAVFYLFGSLGIVWCLGFDASVSEERGTQVSVQNKQSIAGNQNSAPASEKSDPHAATFDISNKATPWRAFFRDPAVWAMMYAHFCGNWGHYNLLSWFPTYFSEELSLDLTNSALVSLLPPLGSVVVAAVASSLADYLISKGVDITGVRKLCQSIAFLSPAVCMLVVSFRPDLSPILTAGLLTVGSSLSTFTLAGLYCTHQDISPKYASVLLGLTNTVGAIPGIVGVPLTGYILDQTKSWTLALFAPSIFFYLSGALVWNIFATSKPKDF